MSTTGSRRVELTLPADDQILMTRELTAAPPLVYRAWTEPELVAQWWPSSRGTMLVAEIDLRVGGRWRWVMRAGEGFEVGFHGEYLEIVPDQRLVHTEVFEGAPGTPEEAEANATDNTIEFLPLDGGGTLVRMLTVCPSREIRDIIVQSGMEAGVQDGMALLDELTQRLAEA
ncbi:SRPBCC family protein [Patulibacter defluvii]|uniref:SRPBCC family protein n=1 Tax=Patulibacter defluvii TaxID=3095358 RepID=UPI002A75A904|nr:SRPBCC family protein [Patulibacter sp. DM4]